MAKILKNETDCRIVYSEIVKGYSYDTLGGFFLKHFGEIESSETERVRRLYLKEMEAQGILSEPEKIKLLEINGHWTKEDEASYRQYQDEIEGLRLSLHKLIIPQQQEHMGKIIEKKIEENKNKWSTRAQLLGTTREIYAGRKAAEFHILSTFYKDKQLTIPAFNQEEIDNLSDEQLNIYMNVYQEIHEVFVDKNFKRIAVCPFFLNTYLMSDNNPYFFYGKPLVQLSTYQLALFNRAAFYKNVVEESPQRPPDEYYEDLDKVIQFYDRQYSIIVGKRSNNQFIR